MRWDVVMDGATRDDLAVAAEATPVEIPALRDLSSSRLLAAGTPWSHLTDPDLPPARRKAVTGSW
jgi:hypothetical protein